MLPVRTCVFRIQFIEYEPGQIQDRRADHPFRVNHGITAVGSRQQVVMVQITVEKYPVRVFPEHFRADFPRPDCQFRNLPVHRIPRAIIADSLQPVQISLALPGRHMYLTEYPGKYLDPLFQGSFPAQYGPRKDAFLQKESGIFVIGIYPAAMPAGQPRQHPMLGFEPGYVPVYFQNDRAEPLRLRR